jgi:alpha-galactosidase
LRNHDSLPPDIFQVDDGYQQSTGNWTVANKKFPHGMKAVADSIHASGKKAGIWIAPFVCEKSSPLVKSHPNWFLKDEKGKFIIAGNNPGWGGKFYAFDIYNEGFRQYLENQLDTLLHVWNYDLVKTDFLFAAGIQPRNGKTRGEIMADAMQWLREMTKGKLLLACGVPLASAFKRTDYCRIGNDMHTAWEYNVLEKMNVRERPTTIGSLQSTIFRRQLNNRFFVNDPDVFFLRKKKNKLTHDQRFSGFLINHLFGGLWFTSDNISEYDSSTMQLYKKHLEKMDIRVKRTVIAENGLSLFAEHTNDTCTVYTLVNLDKKPTFIQLPLGVNGLLNAYGTNANQVTDSTFAREVEMAGIELEKFRSYTAIPVFYRELLEPKLPCIFKIFPEPE